MVVAKRAGRGCDGAPRRRIAALQAGGLALVLLLAGVTDALAAAPRLVKESDADWHTLTNIGGALYFWADQRDGTDLVLSKSDGTTRGTLPVKTFAIFHDEDGQIEGGELAGLQRTLLFGAGEPGTGIELWKSDGTRRGTRLVRDINPGPGLSLPSSFARVGRTVFFIADDGSNGTELWKSDGTRRGTRLVKDVNPGADPSFPTSLTRLGRTVLFFAYRGTTGWELWKSDGTRRGTRLVKDINPGPAASIPRRLRRPGVTDVRPSGLHPSALMRVGRTIYFIGDDGIHGQELWRTDGSAAGTRLVKDITRGPDCTFIDYLARVRDTLFFVASEGIHGIELWKSDGTRRGTRLVRDITQSGSPNGGPTDMYDFKVTLFFRAAELDHDFEPWRSDGTRTGTRRVKDINVGPEGSDPNRWTRVGDILYFVAHEDTHGRELWGTDGTRRGMKLVGDINPGPDGSNNDELTRLGESIYFFASKEGHQRGLWKRAP